MPQQVDPKILTELEVTIACWANEHLGQPSVDVMKEVESMRPNWILHLEQGGVPSSVSKDVLNLIELMALNRVVWAMNKVHEDVQHKKALQN
jgi:hypothetical protein